MIKPRVAPNNKCCLVFDSVQNKDWVKNGKIGTEGIERLLRYFQEEGISLDDVSALNLADVVGKPKAADFKLKAEYCEEFISTSAFNVLTPVGATSFEKLAGYKGLQKYICKALNGELYPNQKIIPLQNPAQCAYDPTVKDNIINTIKLIKSEMEYPELREAEKLPTKYVVLDTLSKVEQWFNHYKNNVNAFAYDTETKGFSFNSPTGALLCLSFSHKAGLSYLLPSDFYGIWTAEEWAKIKSYLQELFNDHSKLLIGHNIKYDNKWIYHHLGIPVRRHNFFCTMVAAFLCNENTPNDLKDCAMKFTDVGDYEFELQRWIDNYCEKSKPKVKKTAFTYDLIPQDVLFKYALTDADVTFRLWEYFKEELIKEEQVEVFNMVNGRFVYLLTKIEINGWPIDCAYGSELRKTLEEEISKIETRLQDFNEIKAATKVLYKIELDKENLKRKKPITELPASKWQGFKFNSNNHKRVLFFDIMRLPVVKYTKAKDTNGKRTTPSTDRESLEDWFYNFPAKGEFLETLQYYAELKKIKSTYVDGILNKVVNGRSHPTYNPMGCKPGRISCRDPNWQNLPARPREPHFITKLPLVKMIKKMVKAPEGRFLLGADLGAIEMRIACIVSGDVKLKEIFQTGIDIHGAITCECLDYVNCHPNEVKKLFKFERDSIFKRVQFLAIYGGSGDTLAKGVNLENRNRVDENGNKLMGDFTKDKGQEILDNYFAKYYGVSQCIEDTTRFIEQNGYAVSIFGRKRRIPEVNAEDEGAKARAIRQGVNSIFQSPASDALLEALYKLQIYIEDHNIDFLITGPIHDAGYGETSNEFKSEARELLLEHLQQFPIPVDIPITAECEGGQSWADFSEDFGNELLKEDDETEDEDDEDVAA